MTGGGKVSAEVTIIMEAKTALCEPGRKQYTASVFVEHKYDNTFLLLMALSPRLIIII